MIKKTTLSKTQETLIGIDYGEKFTGVALGKNGLVHPLKIVDAKNPQQVAQEITRIGLQNKIAYFVIGLPITPDGRETKESGKVRKFGKILKIISKKRVVYQEEIQTSKEALELSLELGTPLKKRKRNDHLSASIILRRYYASLT